MSKTAGTLAIGEVNDMVVLSFPFECTECVLDPETARMAGEALAKAAYHAHTGVKPHEGANILSEQKRGVLINRVKLVINNLQGKQVKPDVLAAQVVDTVLSEVL